MVPTSAATFARPGRHTVERGRCGDDGADPTGDATGPEGTDANRPRRGAEGTTGGTASAAATSAEIAPPPPWRATATAKLVGSRADATTPVLANSSRRSARDRATSATGSDNPRTVAASLTASPEATWSATTSRCARHEGAEIAPDDGRQHRRRGPAGHVARRFEDQPFVGVRQHVDAERTVPALHRSQRGERRDERLTDDALGVVGLLQDQIRVHRLAVAGVEGRHRRSVTQSGAAEEFVTVEGARRSIPFHRRPTVPTI